MAEYEYLREKIPDGRWDIDHPERVDPEQIFLAKEVETALPGKTFRLCCVGASAVFMFDGDDLTIGEKATLDQTVADHKANA